MINQMMPYLGPVVLVINFAIIFMCLRPKYNLFITIGILAAVSLGIQLLTVWLSPVNTQLVRYLGLLYVPLVLWLFQRSPSQKLFGLFVPVQLTILMTHISDAVVGVTIGYDAPQAKAVYIGLSLALLCVYVVLVIRFGRRLLDKIFISGSSAEWSLYAWGAFSSFLLIISLNWSSVGGIQYFFIVLFILWSLSVLCFTIINVHDKAEQTSIAEALSLQMDAMREKLDADKKHLDDMEILRHDMRHEMGVIMELVNTGKIDEAKAVYEDWQESLSATEIKPMCAEPVLNAVFARAKRKADEMNIRLYVNSDIPASLPIDTIKLSVILSNALENAITATNKVAEQSKRAITVKLVHKQEQIGLKVSNPYAEPVTFDSKGIPVTSKAGHGIGVRSIAAFAEERDYPLNFCLEDEKFVMRLVMAAS